MGRDGGDARRGFLKAFTTALATAIAAAVAYPLGRLLGHPLRHPTVTANDDPIRVAAPDDVRAGRPLKVTVTGERRDGWARNERVNLGAAWLVRTPGGRVRAYSTACPHLGCGVDWNERAETFICPCHDSRFAIDGRCVSGPAPRGLDELDVYTSPDDVRIRYKRFRLATADKEPLG